MAETIATAPTPAPGSGLATAAPVSAPVKSKRLMSIDALRGFDMFWIIGADSLVYALHKMSDNPLTSLLATQLDHAEWEGFHFYDLIFPLFVFIMGASTVFSLTKIIAEHGRAGAVMRVVKRGVLLFVIGIIYSGGVTNRWPDIRVMGVLNRIALCYFFGGIIFCLCKPRVIAGIAVGLLAGYWALMTFVQFPDVRPEPDKIPIITREHYKSVDQLNMGSTNMIRGGTIQGVNLADYLDQKYLGGRKYDGTYDPEGLLSTMPAIVTGLLGIFAGLLLKNQSVRDMDKVYLLIGCGIGGVVLGFLWGMQFPVIKKIWTSSYVLVAGGYSAIFMGLFYLIVDVLKLRTWCQPFVWMGMNSITVYLASNFMGGLGFHKLAYRFAGGDILKFFDAHLAAGSGEFIVSIVGLLLAFWFCHFLYKRSIFLRL